MYKHQSTILLPRYLIYTQHNEYITSQSHHQCFLASSTLPLISFRFFFFLSHSTHLLVLNPPYQHFPNPFKHSLLMLSAAEYETRKKNKMKCLKCQNFDFFFFGRRKRLFNLVTWLNRRFSRFLPVLFRFSGSLSGSVSVRF